MRSTLRILATVLALGLLVAAGCGAQAPAAPAPTATPKPPEPLAPAATAMPVPMEPAAPAPTATPEPVAQAEPARPAQPVEAEPSAAFEALSAVVGVQSAIAYVDGASFHDMAEDLEAATEVNARYLSTTRNVLAVLGAAPWPDELDAERHELEETLQALEAALAANDVAKAGEAAAAVHEVQHDLSQGVFAWLAEQDGGGWVDVFATAGSPDHLLGCFGVQSAAAYTDAGGFHDMAADLETATEVNPRYLGRVRNVLSVVSAVAWPADLEAEVEAFAADLEALEAALVANDVKASALAADAAHETQHDLSQAAFGWLGDQSHDFTAMGMMMGSMPMGRAVTTGLQSAQAYIDGAGFHDMAEDLESATEINPRYLGRVRNVMAVMRMVPWPEEVAAEQVGLLTVLEELEAALVSNDVEAARTGAEAVHDTQHDLAQAVYAWLAAQRVS